MNLPMIRGVQRLPLGLAVAILLSPSPAAGLFGPAGTSVSEKQQAIGRQRDAMLSELERLKPGIGARIQKAAGYATFNQKDVNLLLLASGNGYGVLVDNSNHRETYMRMASLGGGLGMGVKDVRVIFIFNDRAVMKQFVESGWQFGGKADASAKYKDAGASAEQNVKANVNFREGSVAAGGSTDARIASGQSGTAAAGATSGGPMEIYQFTESGVSLQATVSGTKYWRDSQLNP